MRSYENTHVKTDLAAGFTNIMTDETTILTIAIITMNRAEQLNEAIHSCFSCKLPDKTQFVIIDNASTDDTGRIIADIKSNNPQWSIDYFYSSTNLGVGYGRNLALKKSKGKFIYFLDDDAVIAPECYDTFFLKCIRLMEDNPNIASLSTNIYDTYCGNSRNLQGYFAENELRDILSWRGGSHFIRGAVLSKFQYLNIRYGCDELAPSIYVWNKGFRNVYFDNVRIIHQPRINKWNKGTKVWNEICKSHIAMRYATYKLLYPSIFYPIIHLSMIVRCWKYFRVNSNIPKECLQLANKTIQSCHVKKISTRTVIMLWKKFRWACF